MFTQLNHYILRSFLYMSILFCLTSCNEDKAKEGQSVSNVLNNIINNNVDPEDLSDLIEEESNFSYQHHLTSVIDYDPSIRIAHNHITTESRRFSILYDQRTISGNRTSLKFFQFDLDAETMKTSNTEITDQYYSIRPADSLGNQYYILTKNPMAIHLYSLQDSTATKVMTFNEGETFSTYNHNQGYLCGHIQNTSNFFHYSGELVSTFLFDGTPNINRLYCLKDAILVMDENKRFYSVSTQNSFKILLDPTDDQCNMTSITLRNGDYYLRCTYVDHLGKNQTKTFAVMPDGSDKYQVDLPINITPSFLYTVKLDNTQGANDKPHSLLYYKKNTETEWRNFPIESDGAEKNVTSLTSTGTDIWALSTRAAYKIQDDQILKYPLHITPKIILSYQEKHFIFDTNATLYMFDPLQETNNYLQALINIFPEDEVNPVIIKLAEEKQTVIFSEQKDSLLISVARRSTLDYLLEIIDLDSYTSKAINDLPEGEQIIDLALGDNHLAIVVKKEDSSFELRLFNYSLEILQTLILDVPQVAYTRISFHQDELLLSTRRQLFYYDTNLEVKWNRSISGMTSMKTLTLPNNRILGVYNSHIVLIDRDNGVFEELYSLTGVGNSLVRQMILKNQILYLNYHMPRLVKIKLPLAKIKY